MTTAIQTTQANPFEPQSMDQAMTLASTLAKSGIIPDTLKGKPADILVVLMTGRELGVGPMQAMRGISVIKGKPVLSADFMVALCLRHRDICEFFRLVESTPAVAHYQTKRLGSEPVDLKWSMQDAERAGLAGGQNWRNHPAAMLRARCSAALARAVYPDLVGGLYEESEGEEMKGHKSAPVVSIAPPPTAPEAPPQPEAVTVEAQVVEAPKEEAPVLTAKEVWGECVKLHGTHAASVLAECRSKIGIPGETKTHDLAPAQLRELADSIAAAARIDF